MNTWESHIYSRSSYTVGYHVVAIVKSCYNLEDFVKSKHGNVKGDHVMYAGRFVRVRKYLISSSHKGKQCDGNQVSYV